MPITGSRGCGLSSGAGLGYASDTAGAADKKGQNMGKWMVTAVVTAAVLVGCGRVSESRLNPFNWFGGDSETVAATPDTTAEVRDDVLIAQVLNLKVEPTPGGAIISTLGLASTQGFWEAVLVPVNNQDGTGLTFEFRVKQPVIAAPVGANAAREVLAGTFLSTQTLGDARTITIVAGQNRRTVSR